MLLDCIVNLQNYWVLGLFPSSGIWEKSKNPVILKALRHRQNPLESKSESCLDGDKGDFLCYKFSTLCEIMIVIFMRCTWRVCVCVWERDMNFHQLNWVCELTSGSPASWLLTHLDMSGLAVLNTNPKLHVRVTCLRFWSIFSPATFRFA
jgi:hypothetical protein